MEKIKQEECPICYDKISPFRFGYVKTICGHSFCINCYQECSTMKPDCPICRNPMFIEKQHVNISDIDDEDNDSETYSSVSDNSETNTDFEDWEDEHFSQCHNCYKLFNTFSSRNEHFENSPYYIFEKNEISPSLLNCDFCFSDEWFIENQHSQSKLRCKGCDDYYCLEDYNYVSVCGEPEEWLTKESIMTLVSKDRERFGNWDEERWKYNFTRPGWINKIDDKDCIMRSYIYALERENKDRIKKDKIETQEKVKLLRIMDGRVEENDSDLSDYETDNDSL